jgi:hypothetical protein
VLIAHAEIRREAIRSLADPSIIGLSTQWVAALLTIPLSEVWCLQHGVADGYVLLLPRIIVLKQVRGTKKCRLQHVNDFVVWLVSWMGTCCTAQ